jgi:uncharacterized tellurite resistance protein B-like protein
MATGDGSIAEPEQAFLLRRVESLVDLHPGEHTRLAAHVRWLLQSRVGVGGLKERIQALDSNQREHLADFAIGVTSADGRVDGKEVRLLQRVFTLLGIDPATVYSRLHALEGPGSSADATARPGRSPMGTRASANDGSSTRAVTLDPERLRAKMAESEAVFGVLKDIFATEEESNAEPTVPSTVGVWGLDSAHSALVRHLVTKDTWDRPEFEDLARRLHLMPNGAVEAINEASFGAVGEFLLEGDDVVEVRLGLLSEPVS